jgi:hypothetical protein
LVLVAASASAQDSVSDATIGGRVIDELGGVVPGVTVHLRHLETNVTAVVVTDAIGRFRVSRLRVGSYEIRATMPAFRPATATVAAAAGSSFDVTLTLALGGLDTEVVVTTTVLDTARTQVAGTVLEAEIAALPLNGRNFLDIALLVPGVSPTNIPSTALFPETSAVPGVGLSVSSQRNFSNNFIVDGLSANDDAAGLSGMTYAVDAVDQVQVVTSGGQAELGRALGGYVNVVTRSGTNRFSGSAFDLFRDDALTAPNTLSGTRLPMRQWQYGGTFGGPITRDRAFFIGSFEQRQLAQSGLVTIPVETAALINAHLAVVGYRGPGVATGLYSNPLDTFNALGKVDYQAGDRRRWTVKYSHYEAASINSRGAGALFGPSASAALDNRDVALSIGHVFVIDPVTVMEARGQIVSSRLDALPSDPIGPAVAITGVATFGTLSTSPTGRDNVMAQAVGSVTRTIGTHVVRTGADVLFNDLAIEFPRAVNGAYTFQSLSAFLAGTYNNAGFAQTFGDQSVVTRKPNVGLYVQDEWKIAPRLTLNAGLRYDVQWLDTIRTDRNNVAPRVGVAWRPFLSDRTVVRANGGLFYDRVPLRALSNALLSAGNTTDLGQLRQFMVNLSPGQRNAPVFPQVLSAAVASTTLPNLTTMDDGLRNARSAQVSVEVEQLLTSLTTVSIGYERLRAQDLVASINQNVPTCVASGGNNGCRPVATYGNNSQYSAVGRSTYDALHVSWLLRPSRWGSYRVSYAFSKSMNNVGEAFFNGPIDPTDIEKDWGRSDDDQRHRFVASGSFETSTAPAGTLWERLGRNLHVSGVIQTYSAAPFNITSGITTIQGTAGRPVVDGAYIERNAGGGSAFLTSSLRLGRLFHLSARSRLDVFAEIFNLTNHQNVVTRNTNFGTGAYPTNPLPTFGQVTAVGESRSGQLGVRFVF